MGHDTNELLKRATSVVIAFILTGASVCSAQTAKYHDSYRLQGFSQPSRVSNVASPTNGIVESIAVKEGQHVKRGECLIRLDRSVHDARLETARVAKHSFGELETATAELAASETRLQRLRELAQRKHSTKVEVLQAEEDVAVSRATVQRAKDKLAQQSAEYERLVAESAQYCVKAPFDGVVVEFSKQVGEYVGPGDPAVCTIVNLDSLSVDFLLPRPYRHNFRVGQDVSVLFTVIGRATVGKISYISPFPNGETNTYTVKVQVKNPDGELSAGERCQLNGMNAQENRTTQETRSVQVSVEKDARAQQISMRSR